MYTAMREEDSRLYTDPVHERAMWSSRYAVADVVQIQIEAEAERYEHHRVEQVRVKGEGGGFRYVLENGNVIGDGDVVAFIARGA